MHGVVTEASRAGYPFVPSLRAGPRAKKAKNGLYLRYATHSPVREMLC